MERPLVNEDDIFSSSERNPFIDFYSIIDRFFLFSSTRMKNDERTKSCTKEHFVVLFIFPVLLVIFIERILLLSSQGRHFIASHDAHIREICVVGQWHTMAFPTRPELAFTKYRTFEVVAPWMWYSNSILEHVNFHEYDKLELSTSGTMFRVLLD